MSTKTTVPPDANCKLMDIPLELRYKIFDVVAARDKGPEHVLAHWFEKRDVDNQIAAYVAADPTGIAPVGRYPKFKAEVEQDDDEGVVGDQDDEEEADHDDDEEEADHDDDEEEADHDDNEDEEDEDPEDEETDQDVDDDDDDDDDHMHFDEDDEDGDQDGDDDMADDDGNMTITTTMVTAPALSTFLAPSTSPGPVVAAGLGNEVEDEDLEEEQEHDQEDGMGEHDNEEDGNDDEMVDDDGIPTTAPPAPVPQAPLQPRVIIPAPKWRHIPKFMSISHCPPPTEVLLTSKELNKQAMDWFYEAAVLHIKGTASFAHPTFFEEAFQQLFDAPFSPMENIRKAEVTLVWDTAWIHASEDRGLYEAILPAFLRQRTAFIIKTLKCAPMLRDLLIHWHDSLKDDDSEALKYDILADFYNIPAANITVKEHFIAPDAKPLKKSKAGKFRVELMDIAERGIQCLYQS